MTSDETKLRQCIVNFLSNAFKFTENGQVALLIDSKKIDGKEFVNFDIKDTGIGMTEEQLESFLILIHKQKDRPALNMEEQD